MFRKLVLIGAMLSLTSCASKMTMDGSDRVEEKGVFSFSGSWVKDKGKKYDAQVNIKNESNYPQALLLADISCFKGKTQGKVGYTTFGIGERTIELLAGETKTLTLGCKLFGPADGTEIKMVVAKVHRDDEGPTKPIHEKKVVAKDITWIAKGKM